MAGGWENVAPPATGPNARKYLDPPAIWIQWLSAPLGVLKTLVQLQSHNYDRADKNAARKARTHLLLNAIRHLINHLLGPFVSTILIMRSLEALRTLRQAFSNRQDLDQVKAQLVRSTRPGCRETLSLFHRLLV